MLIDVMRVEYVFFGVMRVEHRD
jgi:hypothetical protein